MFDATLVYLASKITPSMPKLKVIKPEKEHLKVSIYKDQEVLDSYKGVDLTWTLVSDTHKTKPQPPNGQQRNSRASSASKEVRFYELRFHKKHQDVVLNSYLGYVLEHAKAMKHTRKIHTVIDIYSDGNIWEGTELDHPSTFETLALEPAIKKEVMEDLDLFVARKEYYRRVGKAWKRGYLLYGPPGTGKTSLIAAMANYLDFDVFDLDLNELNYNSDLRKLLISTSNRSILVIEDIDCTIELENRNTTKRKDTKNEKVTLSGLLNFIDGLWSSCGNERIIVFTTNHKDRLDPALLRSGRMDVHIHMSYCSFNCFKILASNYHEVQKHPLFAQVEELIENAQATPADVAGELMKTNDVDKALKGLVEFLKGKIETLRKMDTAQQLEPTKKKDQGRSNV